MPYDVIVIGGGIIGMAVARAVREKRAGARILVIDKEAEPGAHASGRNSGVLHAGFYYTADSLKARFTVAGNREMRDFCRRRGLPVNVCGKLVVARDEAQRGLLEELERRGRRNGSRVRLISADEAAALEPAVRTYRQALHSPDTASVDPAAVCRSLCEELRELGVEVRHSVRYLGRIPSGIRTTAGEFLAVKIVNCAGLYADRIAADFGLGRAYTMIPFKGLYLKYTKNTTDVRMHVYPVPDLRNPFLGVHFTKTVEGTIKIGPTATPAFWRENYAGWRGFSFREFGEIGWYETRLFLTNAFHFRDLAFSEIRKYDRKAFVAMAAEMVPSIDPDGFTEFTRPGIRAQLLEKKTLSLVQDFVVERDAGSVHVLNAVSPAFTCAFPFARYVVSRFL